MNARGPKPPLPPPAAGAGGVRVQKWQAVEPTGLRTKTCDRCGKSFELAREEKFFLCRDCYEQESRRMAGRRRGTAILSLIRCAACGAEEYLDFVPPDPAEALCRACFTRARREQKTKVPHPHA